MTKALEIALFVGGAGLGYVGLHPIATTGLWRTLGREAWGWPLFFAGVAVALLGGGASASIITLWLTNAPR